MKTIAQAFLELQDDLAVAGITLSNEALANLVVIERLRESLVGELADLYQVLNDSN
jgi:hypothetical protein